MMTSNKTERLAPLTSPNTMRCAENKRKMWSPRLKFEFSKGNWVSRKKVGHFKKSSPLKMLFVHDPLNLDTRTELTTCESPNNKSPTLNRSCKFQPGDIVPINMQDPLNLCQPDDLKCQMQPRRRKKRKRRISTCNFVEPDPDGVFHLSKTKKSSDDISPMVETMLQKNNFNNSGNLEKDYANSYKVDIVCNKIESVSNKSEKFYSSSFQTFNKNNLKFKHGNFARGNTSSEDHRLHIFKHEWFCGKRCLDIGCNTGGLTLEILSRFRPKFIAGVDIDEALINTARSNARHLLKFSPQPDRRYPLSIELMHGPVLNAKAFQTGVLQNVTFWTQNYVPEESAEKEAIGQYDVILCLGVTMWMQLNFGDDALKRTFKKIFFQLRPGGRLILEPQTISSYRKKKNISCDIRKNFYEMRFFPNDFVTYLLSSEVGFARSECLSFSQSKRSGVGRPLFLLTKSCNPPETK